MRPDFAAVSEEGLIFLSHSRVTDVYTPEGELVLSLPQQWSSMEWKGTGLLKGNRYITYSESSYISYDISGMSRPPKRRYHFSHQILTCGPHGIGRQRGNIHCQSPGNPPYEPGGSLWETVADGTLNSLSLPSANLRKLFAGNQNDFMSGCPRMTRKS